MEEEPHTRNVVEAYVLVDILETWLQNMETRNALQNVESAYVELLERCAAHRFPHPSTLEWEHCFFLDQVFFRSGGLYLLDDWGRPRTGQEVTISPTTIYAAHEFPEGEGDVQILGLVTGTVKNRGMFTFDLQTPDNDDEW